MHIGFVDLVRIRSVQMENPLQVQGIDPRLKQMIDDYPHLQTALKERIRRDCVMEKCNAYWPKVLDWGLTACMLPDWFHPAGIAVVASKNLLPIGLHYAAQRYPLASRVEDAIQSRLPSGWLGSLLEAIGRVML